MSEHIINNNVSLNLPKSCMDDSPCLTCKHRDTEGGSCALLCLRLAAHSSGESWEDKPLPYIAKQKKKEPVKIVEETEAIDGNDQVSDQILSHQKPICEMPDCSEPAVVRGLCQKDYDSWRNGTIEHPRLGAFKRTSISAKKGTCVFDECDEKAKVRGCCGPHYQSWRKGNIKHPILGIYTTSQASSRSKKPKPDQSQKSRPNPEATEQKTPQKAAKRSYPFPDLVTLDFTNYPEIKRVIFERADELLLPAGHIVMSMLAGMIAGKNET